MMNRRVFFNDDTVRYTLFLPSFSQAGRIVPWCRFILGVGDPLVEAQGSSVSYKRGEGFTGEAWKRPSRIHLQPFPRFKDRRAFDQHYKTLGITDETVKNISDHMVGVQTILTYGFLDTRDRSLGVLSIDFQDALYVQKQSPNLTTPIYMRDDSAFDIGALLAALTTMYNVLESLFITTRRLYG